VNQSGYVTKKLEKKFDFFYQLTPDFDGFWFLPHTECAVNKNKFEVRPKLKVGDGCF
jgi:hypothetical protein